LLARDAPDRHDVQLGLAYAWGNRGKVWQKQRRADDAERAYLEAIKILERLTKDADATVEEHRELAAVYRDLGMFRRDLKRTPEARQSLQQAVLAQSQLAHDHPTPLHQINLAYTLFHLGELTGAVDPREAEKLLVRGRDVLERTLANYPRISKY